MSDPSHNKAAPGDLFAAIKAGDVSAATAILSADATAARQRGADGVSPLMMACYYRQPAIRDLIAAKADPLDAFEAAALGRADRLSELLDGGTSVDAVSPDGFPLVGLACYLGQIDTARLLVKSGADVNALATNGSLLRPIHAAAAAGRDDILALLLEAGADVNAQQRGGFTALHSAAHSNRETMVALLLKHGADRSAKTDDGKSAAELLPADGGDALRAMLAGTA